MGGLGWQNPLPLELGGGRTAVENVYRGLRSAVGIGGAGEIDGLEDLWRQAKAYGIAAGLDTDQRAILQFFPDRATDAIPYYEALLLAPLPPGLEVHERQALLAARFTSPPASNTEEVNLGLQQLDERFSIVALDHSLTEVTVHGRAFEDLAGTLPFGGGRRSTIAPNYSTDFAVIMLLDLAGAPFTDQDVATLERGRNYLTTALPAWVFFGEATGIGFILDEDLLDLTALT